MGGSGSWVLLSRGAGRLASAPGVPAAPSSGSHRPQAGACVLSHEAASKGEGQKGERPRPKREGGRASVSRQREGCPYVVTHVGPLPAPTWPASPRPRPPGPLPPRPLQSVSPTPACSARQTSTAPSQLVSWPLLLPSFCPHSTARGSSPHRIRPPLPSQTLLWLPVSPRVKSKCSFCILCTLWSTLPLLAGLPSRPRQSACLRAFALAVPAA